MRSHLTFVADAILSVVLAPRCADCERVLARPTTGALCPACWSAIAVITPPVCDTCGDPLASWRISDHTHARCARCRRTSGAIDHGRAVGEYRGQLQRVIHLFKYEGRRSLAWELGQRMRRHGADLLAGADCVVPVPLHPRRRYSRGFDQAALLAAQLGLPVVHALSRVRNTPSQTRLPAAQRHRNVRDAFAMVPRRRWSARLLGNGGRRGRDPGSLAGCRVVLVDDVSTTGATLQACARVLKRSGVGEVRALTAARVVSRRA